MFTLISKSFFPNNLKHCCWHKIQKRIFAKKQFIIISVWTLNILSFCFIHILHSRPSFTELGLKQFSMQLASYCKKKKKVGKNLLTMYPNSILDIFAWMMDHRPHRKCDANANLQVRNRNHNDGTKPVDPVLTLNDTLSPLLYH